MRAAEAWFVVGRLVWLGYCARLGADAPLRPGADNALNQTSAAVVPPSGVAPMGAKWPRTSAPWRPGADAALNQTSAAGAPPSGVARRGAKWPRWSRRRPSWKLRGMLPFLASTSPLAGASVFGNGGGLGFWRPLSSQAGVPASSSRGDIAGPLAAPAGRRRFELARRLAGPRASSAPRGRLPLAALALRGGFEFEFALPPEAYAEDPASELSEYEDDSTELEDPLVNEEAHEPVSIPEAWVGDEKALQTCEEALLKSGWRSAFATESLQQMWHIEFFRKKGRLYAEISNYDLPRTENKVGWEFVPVLPVIISGRFVGFSGFSSDGAFDFWFNHDGEDLRVDVYPAEKSAVDGFAFFANPVWRRRSGSSSAPPEGRKVRKPQENKFERNLERLVSFGPQDKRLERAHVSNDDLVKFLLKPGRWWGRTHSRLKLGLRYEVMFGVEDSELVCIVTTRDKEGVALVEMAKLFPSDLDDGTFAFAGTGRKVMHGTADYRFSIQRGFLVMDIGYSPQGTNQRLLLHVLLENMPVTVTAGHSE